MLNNVTMLSVIMPKNGIMLNVIMLSVITLSVIMLKNVIMLSIIMLSGITLNVIVLNAIMLSVILLCVSVPRSRPYKNFYGICTQSFSKLELFTTPRQIFLLIKWSNLQKVWVNLRQKSFMRSSLFLFLEKCRSL
jgi:hypothetical protein